MPGVGELMLASFAPSALVDPQAWFDFLFFLFINSYLPLAWESQSLRETGRGRGEEEGAE